MHARLAGLALAVTTTLMLAAPAAAAVNPTHYEDSTAFHALGAIHQVTNFDASEPDGAPALSDPFVDGDLTILGGPHVVGKFFAPYLPVRNAASFTDPTPLQVAIDAPGYTLLSFDLGDLSGDAAVTLWLFTDKSGYGIGIAAPDAQTAFKFHGFLAPDGEYFTGFSLSPNDGDTLAGVAQIELGKVAAVPEPISWVLMIAGFGASGAMLRARRRSVAGAA
jgi:hypothetical protein